MSSQIIWKLVPLKIMLFAAYGGIGSVGPFINLHMKHLGVSLESAAVVTLVLPLIVSVALPLIGSLTDKLGRPKLVLVTCQLLVVVFICSLLIVPPIYPHSRLKTNASKVEVTFQCDPAGGSLHIPHRCDAQDDCLTNVTALRVSLESCSEPLFTLCNRGVNGDSECRFLDAKRPIVVDVATNPQPVDDQCSLSVRNVELANQDASVSWESVMCNASLNNISCIGYAEPVEDCVSSNGSYNGNHIPCDEQLMVGPYPFWLLAYIVLRCIAEVVISAIFPLMDAITITMTKKHGGNYGQQLMYGMLSIGVLSPCIGLIVDESKTASDSMTFVPAFMLGSGLVLIATVITVFLPIQTEAKSTNLMKDVLVLLADPAVVVFFVVIMCLGAMWGFSESFFYWYIEDLGGTQLLIGLTQSVAIFPSLPTVFFSQWIIDKFGHMSVLLSAFISYAIRFIGYSFIVNPWVSLIFETLKIFSLILAKVGMSVYAANLAPPSLKTTIQTIIILIHYNLARGIGSVIGGSMMNDLGPRTAFQITAVFATVTGIIYFLVHHCYLRPYEARKAKRYQQKPCLVADNMKSPHSEPPLDRSVTGQLLSINNGDHAYIQSKPLQSNEEKLTALLQSQRNVHDRHV